MRIVGGFRLSRAVWLAAHLRLADVIGDASLSAAEIARASGTHAGSLERVLNVLAAHGIFRRGDDGRFGPTPDSELLRSDHPRSQRGWLDLVLGGAHFEAWGALEQAVGTGRTAFDARHGASWIDYHRAHPEEERAFAEAMSATTRAFEDAILEADAFPPFSLAVDVGGSRGSLLRRLLERNPGAQGVVFDLPEEIDGWRDERAEAILRRVREAVRPGGCLAIVEIVLPELPAEHPGWLMDLNMLVLTGGRERTGRAFASLLERSQWRCERITTTASPLSILLARAD